MKNGIELINEERQRQINVEGWSKEHDALHTDGELALAAHCYEIPEAERIYQSVSFFYNDYRLVPVDWLWEREWWKPTPEDRIKELVKAGALYLAANEANGNDEYLDKVNEIADLIDDAQRIGLK